MKTRVLLCNEFSGLKTGYSIYGRELLTRLYKNQQLELAEHASYCEDGNDDIVKFPWKIYPNMPHSSSKEFQEYNTKPENQFGAYRFEEVCLKFKPHVVLSFRDHWMDSHIDSSPFRPYFAQIIMPTCDSFPQNEQWLDTYSRADIVLAYQNWSAKILEAETYGKIKIAGVAPPVAAEEFCPLDKKKIKQQLGFGNYKIIGTVMRNQRRKLFPNLFESFAQLLKQTKRNDILLYCHTSYPDLGWDIPKLLLQYGLSSKVIFTYICRKCGDSFPSFFCDATTVCPKCGQLTAIITSPRVGVDNKTLAYIYNIFDVYVQYANSEGFGIPMVEAAACGVPVMATDFSAMTDIVRKLNGTPIKLLHKELELETGCYRAIPDNQHLVSVLMDFFNANEDKISQMQQDTLKGFKDNYNNWNKTANVWLEQILKINPEIYETRWKRPKYIHQPAIECPQNLSNVQFAKWLIANVLGEPHRLNTYMEARLIKDLNYGATTAAIGGMYYNELGMFLSRIHHEVFNREIAYKHMASLCERRNYWESQR